MSSTLSDGQLLLTALIAIVVLIVLIARFKLHPFIALIGVALATGLATGMPPAVVLKSLQDGVGGALGFIAVVVGLGTMLGKIMAESGGASRIAQTLVRAFGPARVPWAILCVALIVGIPVFFQVGFVLLVPLVFTLVRQTGTPLLLVGLPLLAGLSVVHAMVPPHPAAMLAVTAFKADVGRTILWALLIGVPAAALAGPVFARWITPRVPLTGESIVAAQFKAPERDVLPGFTRTLLTVLLPVLLMLVASASEVLLPDSSLFRRAATFVGHPIVSLLVALLVSLITLARVQRFSRLQLQGFLNECLAPTATILLVIGAGAGFNRVLLDSGVGRAIAAQASAAQLSPLVLAWLVAALVRVATGSATVAMTTAAGIVAPMAASMPGPSPELLVLATGAGSVICSHVNDAGFWLVKEFFGMTVPQTLRTWTVMETILGVSAFLLILLVDALG
jgi:GntP family gluconate:H+ symporter